MFKKIYSIIKKKHLLPHDTWKDTPETYLDKIEEEIKEVREELKKWANIVYLEDEIGDIFWDYLNIVWLLDKDKKIKKKRVFKKCEAKFKERVDAMAHKGMSWWEIKTLQKKRLAKTHKTRYREAS